MPLVAMAERLIDVKNVTIQHMSTIKNAFIAPAMPTIHDRRMKNNTPKIFCIHGRNTPRIIPSFAGGFVFPTESLSSAFGPGVVGL